ncbi:TetR/AcrR family transcriptional regulator [Psychroserpens sp.]|uniref:TetR/AcrR family transcriptional regulator n=1 Tax=Psychroserpens sp. TaxID=2020870 RepID=UPI001B0693B0|nr:TetR/AcrR family transcriptional regulator [Psychroserpens sp.]MBO6606769.1 TetR/AcrR family transcriptional regulator [Psychroserpens sp.]MBO6631832.1 TetR/AcrR family transcriptional regulator [Psychroserpens sp.]MBO6653472.1 TetR/AcrR family transcriptional regulator [Psychroserpens sp.]MBO6680500.1 TetR/AcrR family transcriptional regulator [Psychroserpens sp.]MBO6750541.1 TetR/AcrR family transcriptional regulator [Psychroserpens sp.]
MQTKADLTKEFILETVAPIFNKNGYAATSMSDITKATGLTKGAIYGNFKNKEALAIAAFKYNVKQLLQFIGRHLELSDSPIQKLFLISDFYRNYYNISQQLGGCPILNIGVDANHQNSLLLDNVRSIIEKIQDQLATLIENGIEAGEISSEINAMHYAKRIDTMIQGAVFMTYTMDDEFYMKDAMNQIDQLIHNELKK